MVLAMASSLLCFFGRYFTKGDRPPAQNLLGSRNPRGFARHFSVSRNSRPQHEKKSDHHLQGPEHELHEKRGQRRWRRRMRHVGEKWTLPLSASPVIEIHLTGSAALVTQQSGCERRTRLVSISCGIGHHAVGPYPTRTENDREPEHEC